MQVQLAQTTITLAATDNSPACAEVVIFADGTIRQDGSDEIIGLLLGNLRRCIGELPGLAGHQSEEHLAVLPGLIAHES